MLSAALFLYSVLHARLQNYITSGWHSSFEKRRCDFYLQILSNCSTFNSSTSFYDFLVAIASSRHVSATPVKMTAIIVDLVVCLVFLANVTKVPLKARCLFVGKRLTKPSSVCA